MLVVTKKYEVVDIDITRFVIMILFTTVVVGVVISFIPDMPNSVNVAISIPLGVLASFIWEMARKKNRLYDEEGISLFLTKIAEQDSQYVQDFCMRVTRTRTQSKQILKLDKANTMAEVELLCLFILSSFPELRRQQVKPGYVSELYSKVMAKGSELKKDFGVNFDNLAFLYETNALYNYNNYSIGSEIKLNYTLQDTSLGIKKSFIDYPLLTDDFEFRPEYSDHALKGRYVKLMQTHFFGIYNYAETEKTQKDEFIANHFINLYNLFTEVRDRDEFLPLAVLLAYDLNSLIHAMIHKYGIKIDEVLKEENVNDVDGLERNLWNFMEKHPVFFFFLASTHRSFSIYKDNFEDYEFTDKYEPFIGSIYVAELNRKIYEYDMEELSRVFEEVLELKDRNGNSFYNRLDVFYFDIFEKFYKAHKNNIPMSFEDLDTSYQGAISEIQQARITYMEYRKSLLVMIQYSEKDKVTSILDYVFRNSWGIGFFKSIPLYCFQSFEVFSKHFRDAA